MFGLLSLFESLLQKLLQQGKRASRRLVKLENKYFRIEITDLQCKLYAYFKEQNIHLGLLTSEEIPAENPKSLDLELKTFDTTIKGPSGAYLNLLLSKDPMQAKTKGLIIEGDIIASENLRNLMMELDIDWEEWLSHTTGDFFANNFFSLIRKFNKKRIDFTHSLNHNISEYLHEEIELLPRKEEVDFFVENVDVLRNAVDRLEAKIFFLEQIQINKDNESNNQGEHS